MKSIVLKKGDVYYTWNIMGYQKWHVLLSFIDDGGIFVVSKSYRKRKHFWEYTCLGLWEIELGLACHTFGLKYGFRKGAAKKK